MSSFIDLVKLNIKCSKVFKVLLKYNQEGTYNNYF